MTVITMGQFAPDRPDLSEATNIALNVVPYTQDSYGPLYDIGKFSTNTIGNQPCIGMFAAENVDQTIYMFAGGTQNLFQINGGNPNTWTNASTNTFTAGPEVWRFAQLRSLVFATDYIDPIQVFDMTSSPPSFKVLSAAAPRARHIAVAKTFTIVANTNDPVGGINPARLWWSAAGDPTNWPTPGSTQAQQVQSDYSDVNGPQGPITGLVANLAGCDCAVFFERGVFRMNYVGPPDVFDFSPAENVRGTRFSNAIVPIGNMVYYLGEDGFYAFDGSSSTPIGVDKVDKWFRAQWSGGNVQNVVGAADVQNKLIFWAFPSQDGLTGQLDTLLIYRWDLQRWSYGKINCQWLARSMTFGISVDNMGDIGYSNVDSIPFSFDSPAWLGGVPQIGFVDTLGFLSFFSGNTLQAQVGTAAAQVNPNKISYVQSVRPLVDGGIPTVALSGRTNYYDTENFGPDVPPNVAGECPQRSVGRYHRARITVPAGSSWRQLYGVDVTSIGSGNR